MTPNEVERVVRYTGLTISIVGALVVSPAGTHRLVASTAATARRLTRKTAIWLGFVRPRVHHARAVGDTLSTGSAVAHLIGPGSLTALTLEQQIAQLREQIASVEELLDRTRREVEQDRARTRQELAQLRTDLQRQLDQLVEHLEIQDQQKAAVDSRALVVVGLILSTTSTDLDTRPTLAWSLSPWPSRQRSVCSCTPRVRGGVREHYRAPRSHIREARSGLWRRAHAAA